MRSMSTASAVKRISSSLARLALPAISASANFIGALLQPVLSAPAMACSWSVV